MPAERSFLNGGSMRPRPRRVVLAAALVTTAGIGLKAVANKSPILGTSYTANEIADAEPTRNGHGRTGKAAGLT
jgi:hypothetical protein